VLNVTPGNTLHIYVGGHGLSSISGIAAGGFNGGGQGYASSSFEPGNGGGGASDVRLNTTALASRVIVAGGGGGGGEDTGDSYGHGGGLTGVGYFAYDATQTSAGSGGGLGFGGGTGNGDGGGGGGGLYGGGTFSSSTIGTDTEGGGGGSGYIGGVTGATVLLSGNNIMPNPIGTGSITGNSGHGYVRLTYPSVCQISARVPGIINVSTTPTLAVNSGSICSGGSFSMNPTGATSYTYSSGSPVVSPTATSAYTVTGSNGACIGTPVVSNVTVNALPSVIAASSNTAFICVGSTATLTATGAITYVWNTTATTAVIAVSPTTTTSYTVTGTGANGCTANAVISQSVSTCTGINSNFSNLSSNFIVYPNPSNGIFNLQLDTSTPLSLTTIEVTDVLGRVILTDKVKSGNYELNLGNNVNGIYFIKATFDGKTKTVKIIKE
jgi:hypothetical protein